MFRSRFLTLTLLAAVASPVSGLHAQARAEGSGMPSQEELITSLKERGLRLVQGCDYIGYLQDVRQIQDAQKFLQQLTSLTDITKNPGMPLMDLIDTGLRHTAEQQTVESAKAQLDGLLYQLQSTCHTDVTRQENERMRALAERAALGIGKALFGVLGQSQPRFKLASLADSLNAHLTSRFADRYEQRFAGSGTPEDSLYTQVSATLRSTLQESERIVNMTSMLDEEMEALQKASLVYAQRDSTGKWACPDHDVQPPAGAGSNFVCGFVSPERASQLTAIAETRKLQTRTVQQMLDARKLEIASVELMATTERQRVRESVQRRPIGF
jgi:hypothetical protein